MKIETIKIKNSKGDVIICNKGDEKNYEGYKASGKSPKKED